MKLVETFMALFARELIPPRVVFGPIPDDAKIVSMSVAHIGKDVYVEVEYQPRRRDGTFGDVCVGYEDRVEEVAVLTRRLAAGLTWQQ